MALTGALFAQCPSKHATCSDLEKHEMISDVAREGEKALRIGRAV
jgi:hypothetical protein